jgi:hypothetical protein
MILEPVLHGCHVQEEDCQGVEQAVHHTALWFIGCPQSGQHQVVGQRDEQDSQGQQQPHSQGEGLVQGLPFCVFKWQWRGNPASIYCGGLI